MLVWHFEQLPVHVAQQAAAAAFEAGAAYEAGAACEVEAAFAADNLGAALALDQVEDDKPARFAEQASAAWRAVAEQALALAWNEALAPSSAGPFGPGQQETG